MQTGLDGHTILVVEDDALIALDLEMAFADAGARIIGPAHSVAAALAMIDAAIESSGHDAVPLDGAVLDVHLKDGTCEAVAARLDALGVPFVYHSGHARDAQAFVARSERPHLRKPATTTDLVSALRIEP